MSLPPIEQGITPEETRPARLASGVCPTWLSAIRGSVPNPVGMAGYGNVTCGTLRRGTC
jgi:hypothetical protein